MAVLGAVTLIWLVSVYNGLIGLKRQVRRAWADVDALLKRRWDLVPNLVATVKGAAQHEQETLTRVTEAGSLAHSAPDTATRIGAEMELGRSLPALIAVAEAHPTLRAGANFLELQRELSRLEESIADRREFYNNVATNYNTRLSTFPGAFFQGAVGGGEEPLFSAEGAERSVPSVAL